MALIDIWYQRQKQRPKLTFWQKVWVLFKTSADMSFDRVKPGGKCSGPLGLRAPMSYPQTFLLGLLFVSIIFIFFMARF